MTDYRIEDRGYDTPCWIWACAIDRKTGYGRLSLDLKTEYAHRWYYQALVGAIPERYHVDHLCRVESCVNPEHLEAVTHAENIRRGKGTRLTAEDVRAIRESDETHAALGRYYSVHESHINRIRSRKKWADVL